MAPRRRVYLHMNRNDHDKVSRAYVAAWERTGDHDAAYAAAEQTYRILHPETTDGALVKCIVAVALGGMIGETAPAWADGRQPDPLQREDPTAA